MQRWRGRSVAVVARGRLIGSRSRSFPSLRQIMNLRKACLSDARSRICELVIQDGCDCDCEVPLCLLPEQDLGRCSHETFRVRRQRRIEAAKERGRTSRRIELALQQSSDDRMPRVMRKNRGEFVDLPVRTMRDYSQRICQNLRLRDRDDKTERRHHCVRCGWTLGRAGQSGLPFAQEIGARQPRQRLRSRPRRGSRSGSSFCSFLC